MPIEKPYNLNMTTETLDTSEIIEIATTPLGELNGSQRMRFEITAPAKARVLDDVRALAMLGGGVPPGHPHSIETTIEKEEPCSDGRVLSVYVITASQRSIEFCKQDIEHSIREWNLTHCPEYAEQEIGPNERAFREMGFRGLPRPI